MKGINFCCEYLDLMSCGCRFINSTNRVPQGEDRSGAGCLNCLIGLYMARGETVRVS